jgi:TRAP-type mannitol/chloroaromatic compound transport system permease small subunit
MGALMGFSNGVDRLNTWLNKYVIWLILIATLVSAVNALVRKIFNTSSNAFGK